MKTKAKVERGAPVREDGPTLLQGQAAAIPKGRNPPGRNHPVIPLLSSFEADFDDEELGEMPSNSRWRNRIVGHGEVDARELLANPKNWRAHPAEQKKAMAGVLGAVGWVQDVIVNRLTGFMVDGHLRAAMALEAGEKVPVVYVELTPEEESVILATLDPLAAMAESNKAAFDQLVGGMDDAFKALVDATGGDVGGRTGLTDDDAAPDPPATPTSRAGDCWLLGPHRLLVGDATDQSSVLKVLGGQLADVVFTDPPYNVAYEGYTEERMTIEGDRMTAVAFKEFLDAAFRAIRVGLKPGGSVYVCHSSSWQREFQNALEAAGFEVRCQIIWAKNTFAWGFGRYKFQHEPIFYAHVAGQSDPWYGDKSQSTLWEEKKPSASRLHPTMKPVELIERALLNSSKAGDIVLDTFGGSGSTLIACHKMDRLARLTELDPHYADVICMRWESYSGQQATLEGLGTTFEHVKAGRQMEAEDAIKEELVEMMETNA